MRHLGGRGSYGPQRGALIGGRGAHPCAEGRMITCAAGRVTSKTQAPGVEAASAHLAEDEGMHGVWDTAIILFFT